MNQNKAISSLRHYAENLIIELQIVIAESSEGEISGPVFIEKLEKVSQKLVQETKKAKSMIN